MENEDDGMEPPQMESLDGSDCDNEELNGPNTATHASAAKTAASATPGDVDASDDEEVMFTKDSVSIAAKTALYETPKSSNDAISTRDDHDSPLVAEKAMRVLGLRETSNADLNAGMNINHFPSSDNDVDNNEDDDFIGDNDILLDEDGCPIVAPKAKKVLGLKAATHLTPPPSTSSDSSKARSLFGVNVSRSSSKQSVEDNADTPLQPVKIIPSRKHPRKSVDQNASMSELMKRASVNVNGIMSDLYSVVIDGEADYFGDSPAENTVVVDPAGKKKVTDELTALPSSTISRVATEMPTIIRARKNSTLVIMRDGECGMAPPGTVFEEDVIRTKQDKIRDAMRKMEEARMLKLTIQVRRSDDVEQIVDYEITNMMTAKDVVEQIIGGSTQSSSGFGLFEVIEKLNIERWLEDFEIVADAQKTWGTSDDYQWQLRSFPNRYKLSTNMKSFQPMAKDTSVMMPIHFRTGKHGEKFKPRTVIVNGTGIFSCKGDKPEKLMMDLSDYSLYTGVNNLGSKASTLSYIVCLRPPRSFDPEEIKAFGFADPSEYLRFMNLLRCAKHGSALAQAWGSWVPPVTLGEDDYDDDDEESGDY